MERKEIKEVKVKKEGGMIEVIVTALAVLLFFPLIIPILIVMLTQSKKCKHWRECPWYNNRDDTCNKDEGMYYDFDRPGGCYVDVEHRKKELAQQGKRLRRLR